MTNFRLRQPRKKFWDKKIDWNSSCSTVEGNQKYFRFKYYVHRFHSLSSKTDFWNNSILRDFIHFENVLKAVFKPKLSKIKLFKIILKPTFGRKWNLEIWLQKHNCQLFRFYTNEKFPTDTGMSLQL